MKKFLLFLIGIFIVFIGLLIYGFSGFAYYDLVDYIEVDNKRYALYNNKGFDGDSFLIVEQNLKYKDFNKIKTSSISLISKTGDKKNKYIYHFIPFDFTYYNPKLRKKGNYLIFELDGLYHFAYNIKTGKKYFSNDLEDMYRNERKLEWNSKVDKYDYFKWKKEKIHNKILEIINKKND